MRVCGSLSEGRLAWRTAGVGLAGWPGTLTCLLLRPSQGDGSFKPLQETESQGPSFAVPRVRGQNQTAVKRQLRRGMGTGEEAKEQREGERKRAEREEDGRQKKTEQKNLHSKTIRRKRVHPAPLKSSRLSCPGSPRPDNILSLPSMRRPSSQEAPPLCPSLSKLLTLANKVILGFPGRQL